MRKPYFEIFFDFFAFFCPASVFPFPQKSKPFQGFFRSPSLLPLARFMSTFPGVSFRRKRNVSSISRRDLREISSVCISLFSPLQPCSRFFPGSRSRFSLLTRFHPFWQTSDVCSFFCARSVAGRGGNVYNRGTARKPSSCEEAARPSPDMLFVAADSSSVDRIRLNRRPLRGLL